MKKLITLAAIIFIAVGSHAAPVAWSSGYLYSTNPDGSLNNALFLEGGFSGSAWLVMLGTGNAGQISVNTSGSLTIGAGSTLYGTQTLQTVPSYNDGPLPDSTLDGEAFVMVAFDSATQMYGISASQNVIWVGASSSYEFAAGFQNDGGSNPALEPYLAMNVQAVPEPTSMALLGLGVAAFALRRRMKK
jgi:hypothetical protein